VTELWHFSEDPFLDRFVPRDGKVWAIDAPHSWLYWFERLRSVRLYAYRMPPEPFDLVMDQRFYVSSTPVDGNAVRA
jgi:hypothetical protein